MTHTAPVVRRLGETTSPAEIFAPAVCKAVKLAQEELRRRKYRNHGLRRRG